MTVATQGVSRAPRPRSLADVLEVVLDKGIVIDAYVRVAIVGIELLTVDARIVIASVDTHLRFAEAVNRMDLQPDGQVAGLPGLIGEITESGAKHETKDALPEAKDTAKDAVSSPTGSDDEDENGAEEEKSDGREAPDVVSLGPAEARGGLCDLPEPDDRRQRSSQKEFRQMNETAKLGAAVVGGYALGRKKKGKKALTLALWLAAREYGFQPRELLMEGLTRLARSPGGGAQLIENVRGPLVDAGKRAVMATVQGGVDSLGKNLRGRADGLTGTEDQSSSDSDESEKDTSRRRARSNRKSKSGETASAKRPSTGSRGSGDADARAKRSPAKASTARKSDSGPARKSSSGTRTTSRTKS